MMFLAKCDVGDATDAVLTVLYYVRLVVRILQIVVPAALIVWGTIDMGKAVIAGDEKKIKEAKKPLIQRFISAIIVFLIPFLVNIIVNFVTAKTEYKDCWNAATEPKINIKENDGMQP
ncbi:MAG: hypothetical protein J6B64_01300 [Bacilli bacterium]|nr:hypothetical protein [Bacilli bacterium]MBP3635140.1 hypothetical protein [Bacilli bacterium]